MTRSPSPTAVRMKASRRALISVAQGSRGRAELAKPQTVIAGDSATVVMTRRRSRLPPEGEQR